MNFAITHKIFSIALSFLVLILSLSLTIEKHFCGETLVDVSIFSEPDNCCDDSLEVAKSDTIKKSCCKDEVDILDGLSEITINSFEDLDVIHQQVLFAYSYSYLNRFEDFSNGVISYKNYSPPKLIKDIHVLDEKFLI